MSIRESNYIKIRLRTQLLHLDVQKSTITIYFRTFVLSVLLCQGKFYLVTGKSLRLQVPLGGEWFSDTQNNLSTTV